MTRNDDEDDRLEFKNRARAVSEIFRRQPHNAIEELEKPGFAHAPDEGGYEALEEFKIRFQSGAPRRKVIDALTEANRLTEDAIVF